MECHL